MTPDYRGRHRKTGVIAELAARPLVLIPAVVALMVFSLGYGVIAGVAHGYADAVQLQTVAETCTPLERQ